MRTLNIRDVVKETPVMWYKNLLRRHGYTLPRSIGIRTAIKNMIDKYGLERFKILAERLVENFEEIKKLYSMCKYVHLPFPHPYLLELDSIVQYLEEKKKIDILHRAKDPTPLINALKKKDKELLERLVLQLVEQYGFIEAMETLLLAYLKLGLKRDNVYDELKAKALIAHSKKQKEEGKDEGSSD
ncbi:MAG: hypothetical protein QXT86_08865 [Archaeoglobaceae archaeon]